MRWQKGVNRLRIRLKSFFHFDVGRAFGSEWVEFPGDILTLRRVLEEVAQKTEGRVQIIDRVQGIDSEYFVLVNGIEVPSTPRSLAMELHEGDEVGVGMMHFWGGG